MTQERMSAAAYRAAQGLDAPGADRERPAKRQPVQRELALQMASAEWLDALEWTGPKPLHTHVPNERRSLLEAVRMKRCGVRKGITDWIFALPAGRTLWIELKDGSSVRPEQREVRAELEALGHLWRLARSIEEMAAAMREAGLEFRETPKAQAIRKGF